MLDTVWICTFIAFVIVYFFTFLNLSSYNTKGMIPWPEELLVNGVYPSEDIFFYYIPITMSIAKWRNQAIGVDI